MYFIQSKDIEELENTIRSVQQSANPNCLLIVRGLPGMGKSHLASLISNKYQGIHYESDQKFTSGGVYTWDGSKVQAAHEMTRHDVKLCMLQQAPMIIVSNTSTMRWEYEPYIQLAMHYQYTVIVYDLYLRIVEYMKDSLPYLNRTEANVNDLKTNYLEFLGKNNVHEVGIEKIQIMSNRYQFQQEIIEIILPPHHPSPSGALTSSSSASFSLSAAVGGSEGGTDDTSCGQKYLEVYDAGYYLGLLVNVAEDLTHDHSAIFWACIFAGYELMKVFGISSGYNMIRKLVNRNLASSEFRNRTTDMTAEMNTKKLMKLNAGWAKYHITVLSPPEYDALKAQGVLSDFISRLQYLRLDEINDQFKSLLPSSSNNSSVGEEGLAFTSSLAYQQLIDNIGMLQGEIADKNTAPARLDQFASTLLNTHTDHDTAVETEGGTGTGTTLTPLLLSSTFYLLLDKTNGILREIDEMRSTFLQACMTEGVITEWTPHITLAFSHNDIHEKMFNGQTVSRSAGIYAFQQIRQLALRKRKQLADESKEEVVDENQMDCGDLPLTDLEEDSCYPFFAELAVHSEVNASFSYAFSFIICDCKIRKGPFGDDESYRTHSVLMKLLPRGLVVVQHQITRAIYRGLFSLKKFYGKEGMEDDGFGMNAGELNFKLHQHMKTAEQVMLMEKVNGRAGSCRFFRYAGQDYVIVGTKLAHTIGRVDRLAKNIVLSDEFAQFAAAAAPVDSKGDSSDGNVVDALEDVEDILTNNSKGGKIDYEKIEYNRNQLIFSNVNALVRSIKWEHFDEMLEWFGGCTMNGEILDPQEMHLVIIDKLQWVVLCTTKFPAEELTFNKKSMVIANSKQDQGEEEPSVARDSDKHVSLTDTLQSFAQYFLFTPSFEVHNLQDTRKEITLEADIIPAKIQKTMDLAKALIFERCSEGKVLYLLDARSRVLEMMKYKTWWYIYRRSIREVVSKLLHRYFSPADANATNGKNESKPKKANTSEDQLMKLYQLRDQLSKAKNLSTNPGLQAKLQTIAEQIKQLENPVVPQPVGRPLLKPLVEEIQSEIKNRWPTKFNFLKNEMQEVFYEKTTMAIDLALQFVEFIHQRLQKDEREVVVKFRKQYPLLWEDFLIEFHVKSDI